MINKRIIGDNHRPFVTAEIGINHEGNINKAKQMIKDAHNAGAECVKFQSHVIDDEMIPAAKTVIPGNSKESIYTIMERCSLNESEEIELKKYVESLGMIYLCTPFSRAAADRLEKMGVSAYKIGSGECNNYPLIKHIASFGKPIILSTGMNDIKSISKSVKIFENASIKYALLHCTSIYPTPYDRVRLGALNILRKKFPKAVLGLSDHSIGNYTCFAAVTLGASILEKHFTSNKKWPGPDNAMSITSKELNDLITGCNAIHMALGGKKEILKEEKPTINFAYACVVSTKTIKKGNILTKENIWTKRPGTGEIKAEYYEKILGKKTNKDIPNNTHLKWNQIEK
ncbi:MAG: N-acetylneuraminate synthase family protein [Euryarchaeota archaeon]|nr:N-acetylneuraminate synthase family protein [Euryarchaeota archaeon]